MIIFGRGCLWIVLMAGLTLSSCRTGSVKTSDRDIATISYMDLLEMLQDNKRTSVLIDVRPTDKFAQGHIPGAINIHLPDLHSGEDRVAEADNIIVYGQDAADLLSPAAQKKLLAIGYRNVYIFREGLALWLSKNKPIKKPGELENAVPEISTTAGER